MIKLDEETLHIIKVAEEIVQAKINEFEPLFDQAKVLINKAIPIGKELSEITKPLCRIRGVDGDEEGCKGCEFRKWNDVCKKISIAADEWREVE